MLGAKKMAQFHRIVGDAFYVSVCKYSPRISQASEYGSLHSPSRISEPNEQLSIPQKIAKLDLGKQN